MVLELSGREVTRRSTGHIKGAWLHRFETTEDTAQRPGVVCLYPIVEALDIVGLRLDLSVPHRRIRTLGTYPQGGSRQVLWHLYHRLACSMWVDRRDVDNQAIYSRAGMDDHAFKRLMTGLRLPWTEETPTLGALVRLAGVLGMSVEAVSADTKLVRPSGWPDEAPRLRYVELRQ